MYLKRQHKCFEHHVLLLNSGLTCFGSSYNLSGTWWKFVKLNIVSHASVVAKLYRFFIAQILCYNAPWFSFLALITFVCEDNNRRIFFEANPQKCICQLSCTRWFSSVGTTVDSENRFVHLLRSTSAGCQLATGCSSPSFLALALLPCQFNPPPTQASSLALTVAHLIYEGPDWTSR